PAVDHQWADEPPAQSPEAGSRHGEVDLVINVLAAFREHVGQSHVRPVVGRVNFVVDAGNVVLPTSIPEPAQAAPVPDGDLQYAFTHPAVRIQLAAVLDDGFLAAPPPVVLVAAPRPAHVPLPSTRGFFLNHLCFMDMVAVLPPRPMTPFGRPKRE